MNILPTMAFSGNIDKDSNYIAIFDNVCNELEIKINNDFGEAGKPFVRIEKRDKENDCKGYIYGMGNPIVINKHKYLVTHEENSYGGWIAFPPNEISDTNFYCKLSINDGKSENGKRKYIKIEYEYINGKWKMIAMKEHHWHYAKWDCHEFNPFDAFASQISFEKINGVWKKLNFKTNFEEYKKHCEEFISLINKLYISKNPNRPIATLIPDKDGLHYWVNFMHSNEAKEGFKAYGEDGYFCANQVKMVPIPDNPMIIKCYITNYSNYNTIRTNKMNSFNLIFQYENGKWMDKSLAGCLRWY